MSSAQQETRRSRPSRGDEARGLLLAGLPVTEKRQLLAGVSTAVLEGGAGPPVVLLHGPGAYAAAWLRVIPGLVTTHQVVAPDLPGQGASTVATGKLDVDRVVAWLAELVERTCPSPPVVVGHLLGGAIAARFAADHADRLSRLVLVDTFGLAPFEPSPEFGSALMEFLGQPTAETHDRLWERCSFDLDGLHEALGTRWEAIKTYNLELANTPGVGETGGKLMELFAMPAIPEEVLGRIAAPTTLISGIPDSQSHPRLTQASATI